MRTFAIVCLAIATVVADSDPEAYTPLQVALGQTKGGVITGVDYGHGSGLIPAVGVAPVAAAHAVPVAAAHAIHAAPAVVSSYAAPALVPGYSALPYTGYAGQYLGGYAGHLGYSGLLGYNRHNLGKREADAEADAYTIGQVAHGLTQGGVVTGIDYGTGLVPAVGVAPIAAAHAIHAAPAVVSSYAAPALVSGYSTLPYTGYAAQYLAGYTGHLGYSGLLGYNRHNLGKREADPEADAYTIGQVAHGLTQGGVVTGVDYGNGLVSGYGAIGNRAVAYTATHALPVATHAATIATHNVPAVVSTYAGLPYTGYAGLAGLGYTGYTGLAGLGYNRHYLAKREADSEADAYTLGQVAHGLPYANAVAVGNAHNPGYITGTNAPVATYAHGIPTTTYAHGLPATTYSVPAYTTGYAGHLGYGYGLRSLGWNY